MITQRLQAGGLPHIINLFPPRQEGTFAQVITETTNFRHLTICGGTGIRTPDTLSSMPVFKTGAINRSAIPPLCVTRENRTPTESATNFRPTIRP